MNATSRFLTADHPDAYIDHPSPAEMLEKWRKYFPKNPDPHVCPKCKGYGGHNLEVNAYQLRPGMENTPENRHKYCHFRCFCMQCAGWGYVTSEADAKCAHDFDHGKNVGRCLTKYTCKTCGHSIEVDSSD